MTERQIEQHAEKIWGYVRNHQRSLDSERVIKGMIAMVKEATDKSQAEMEAVKKIVRLARERLRKLRKSFDELSVDLDELEAELKAKLPAS